MGFVQHFGHCPGVRRDRTLRRFLDFRHGIGLGNDLQVVAGIAEQCESVTAFLFGQPAVDKWVFHDYFLLFFVFCGVEFLFLHSGGRGGGTGGPIGGSLKYKNASTQLFNPIPHSINIATRLVTDIRVSLRSIVYCNPNREVRIFVKLFIFFLRVKN